MKFRRIIVASLLGGLLSGGGHLIVNYNQNSTYNSQSYVYEQAVESNNFWESVNAGERPDQDSSWYQVYVDLEPWLEESTAVNESRLIPNTIIDVEIDESSVPETFRDKYLETTQSSQESLNSEFLLDLERTKNGQIPVENVSPITAQKYDFKWENLTFWSAIGFTSILVTLSLYALSRRVLAELSNRQSQRRLDRQQAKREADKASEKQALIEELGEYMERFGLKEDYNTLKNLEARIASSEIPPQFKTPLLQKVSELEQDMLTPDEQYKLHSDLLQQQIDELDGKHQERKTSYEYGAKQVLEG